MEELFEEYGSTLIAILVIFAILSIVSIFFLKNDLIIKYIQELIWNDAGYPI